MSETTPSVNTLFPWHAGDLSQLVGQYHAKKLAHALLISGEEGSGKIEFSRSLAKSLMCSSVKSDNTACGQCRSCLLLAAQTHPDYLEVTPEADSQVIKVDQTRHLPDFLSLTRHVSAARVIIIYPAEMMNTFSMNALLKTLEEPPENTYLLVVSHNPSLLLATIRSRCIQFTLAQPDRTEVYDWLTTQNLVNDTNRETVESLFDAVGNKPKRVQAFINANLGEVSLVWLQQLEAILTGSESSVKVATSWGKQDISQILFMLHAWLADLIKIMSSAEPFERTERPKTAQFSILRNMASKLEITQVYDYYDKTIEAIRLSTKPINQQLLLESLLIDWQQLVHKQAVERTANGH